MADPTMRDVLDELATLRGTVEAQGAELASYRRRRRYGSTTRRLLPVLLAALLVAVVPLAALAANPFNDLTGGVHDPNIDAIYNAGITRGCDPDVSYCPTGLVTREEMASFLARTAGLGSNPPVANARTAQTAQNATTAQSAVTAETATNATNATNAQNAQNAAALGGQPASAYLPSSGDTIVAYSAAGAWRQTGATSSNSTNGNTIFVIQGNSTDEIYVALPRISAAYGRQLAVKNLRVCYRVGAAALRITGTQLTALADSNGAPSNTILNDATVRAATTDSCYDLAAAPRATPGNTILTLRMGNTGSSSLAIYINSITLTLTPLAP